METSKWQRAIRALEQVAQSPALAPAAHSVRLRQGGAFYLAEVKTGSQWRALLNTAPRVAYLGWRSLIWGPARLPRCWSSFRSLWAGGRGRQLCDNKIRKVNVSSGPLSCPSRMAAPGLDRNRPTRASASGNAVRLLWALFPPSTDSRSRAAQQSARSSVRFRQCRPALSGPEPTTGPLPKSGP